MQIAVCGPAGKRLADPLRRLLVRAAPFTASPLRDLSIVLAGNALMSKLHQQFMGDPSVTDVLTFPIDVDGRGRPISGEIYICVPHATKLAKELGVEPLNELLLYALHGLLHLSGFDDRTAADFRRMHRREDDILRRLGIGPIFAAASTRRPLRGAKTS